MKVDELANGLQVYLDRGAKKVLLPITLAVDIATVPGELMGHSAWCFMLHHRMWCLRRWGGEWNNYTNCHTEVPAYIIVVENNYKE